MGVGTSIFTIAVGAILDFAVKIQNSRGFNINKIGLVLMIVGVVGLVISLVFWGSWGGVGSYRRTRSVIGTTGRTYIDSAGRQVVEPGTTYVEEQNRY